MDFEHTWQVLDVKGLPMSPIVLILAIFVEIVGGIFVLLGINTKPVALIMGIYLIPVTFIFYPPWAGIGPFEHFVENLAIIGGLLTIAYHGAGPKSLDAQHLW